MRYAKALKWHSAAPPLITASELHPLKGFQGKVPPALVAVAVSVMLFATGAGAADEPLSPAERLVLQNAAAGETTDFSDEERFPQAADRTLDATFLAGLLTKPSGAGEVHRRGIRIVGAEVAGPLELELADVEHYFECIACQFGRFNMVSSHFHSGLYLNESTFDSMLGWDARMESNVHFDGARFNGTADFGFSEFKSQLSLIGARFASEDKVANFTSVKVGDIVFLRDAVFAGGADFSVARIGTAFDMDGAHFNSKENVASFNGIKAGNTLFGREATFKGPTDFAYAEIVGALDLEDARFLSQSEAADFNSIKVGAYVSLRRAMFNGPTSFSRADVGTHFDASEAAFSGREGDQGVSLDLSGSRIKSRLILQRAQFSDRTLFTLSEAGRLEAQKASFRGPADFGAMRVASYGDFQNAVFDEEVVLSHSSFGLDVNFNGTNWPEIRVVDERGKNPPVHLRNMAYRNIYGGSSGQYQDDSYNWTEISPIFQRAEYRSQNYADLEAYYRRLGRSHDADEVYIQLRRGDRPPASWPVGWIQTVGDIANDFSMCYGKCLWRVWLVALAVVIFGMICFWKEDWMEKRTTQDGFTYKYNRLWYSLDLFAPVISLHIRDNWWPSSNRHFRYHYARIHTLLGWILVPFAVAGLTGLIK
jgi:hypothetical protein